MTDLTPAARAVLEAVTWKKYDVPPEGLPAFAEEMAPLIAAALRAAADQVLPLYMCNLGSTRGTTRLSVRHKLLAIADELENTNA